ncbi:hypothetical protein ACFOZ7_22870 [Natribaculum luteum]|uniref:Halobacterial output domain-containing protein n=1 Tax=Natribaculum luteum TaxID=1586232 RepID=A0ABD5P607_9EURY|nr:hypothetical protein [Natribaculum luteum]
MKRSREDVLVCADVLGAFGVTPADVRSADQPTETSLETALEDALRDARDRTAFLRQTICRSARGVDCSARYSRETLRRGLTTAFAAVDWSLSIAGHGGELRLEATDPAGRSRETTISYPETPLGTDNLPAVLYAINERVLGGVDARFVLLSSGVDRWRAALIEPDELERVREQYGDRVSAFDRPLVPEHDPIAYVPDERETACDPWPPWAADRRGRAGVDASAPAETTAAGGDGVESLIDEAEPARAASSPTAEAGDAAEPDGPDRRGGLEIVGGSPTVSRRPADAADSTGDAGDRSDGGDSSVGDRPGETETGPGSTGDRNDRASVVSRRTKRSTDASGFGTLSGSAKTARVSNDSFGAGVESQTEDDRYRALGAALGTGKSVSVKGLLDDDEFLPELPASGPDETRIEFEDEFDPGAMSEAKAAAEESGFVWVDAGSVETTRVSNG